MQASKDTVVVFDYLLTDKNGVELDSSDGHGPLGFIMGRGQIIPGLEAHMTGKKAGDAFKVTVPAKDAYGERDNNLQQAVPRAQFQADQEIVVGMEFETEDENGPYVVTVTNVTADTVTIDGNHPLAGIDLTFDVKVVEVRTASSEELAHNHVHGAGGHHH